LALEQAALRVCIVGCGDMGTKHALRWNALAEAQVVAVVDVQPDRAARLVAACGPERAQAYSDYREAVARADVDVVSVCVPTCLHPEITICAAEHGKHVLCEKPIALTVADAEAMRAAAERRGVKLAVGFMRRHSPALAVLRGLLADGVTGRPALYHAVDARELRPKRVMHDPHANGGPVLDMGVHLFDLWSAIFEARPVEVFAQGFALAQGRPEISHIPQAAVDTASIVVRYASGAG
jgi:predicted dehydrogenase